MSKKFIELNPIDNELVQTNELDTKARQTVSPLKKEMFAFSAKLIQKDFIEPYIKGKITPISPLIIAYLVDLYSTRNENMFKNVFVNDRFIDQLCSDLIQELSLQDNTNSEIDDFSFKLNAIYKNTSFIKLRNYFNKNDKSQNEQESIYKAKLLELSTTSNIYEVNFFKHYFTQNEEGKYDHKEFDLHFATDKFEVDVELKNKLTVFLEDIVSFYVKCFYKLYHYKQGKLNSDISVETIDFSTNTINSLPSHSKSIFVFACRNIDKFEKHFKKGYINTLVYNEIFKKSKLKPALKYNENSNLIAELSKHIVFMDLEKSVFFNHTLEETELLNMELKINKKSYLFTDYFDVIANLDEKDLKAICSEQFHQFVYLFNEKVINLAIDNHLVEPGEYASYQIPIEITNCKIIK